MSETQPIEQPPYLLMAAALRSQDVLDIAELAAMRVASFVAASLGGALPGDATDPPLTDPVKAARFALAQQVASRKLPQRILAIGLLQAPDVLAAAASDPANVATAMLGADLADAWRRNWTDYALLQAAIAPAVSPPAGA